MPRNISFALTTPQFLDGSKDVTRRMGWRYLRAGDVLMAVEKSQGLGKGGKIKRLGLIKVIDARREPLNEMCYQRPMARKWRAKDSRAETKPILCCGSPIATIAGGCTVVTRIEFERVTACHLGGPRDNDFV